MCFIADVREAEGSVFLFFFLFTAHGKKKCVLRDGLLLACGVLGCVWRVRRRRKERKMKDGN